MQKVEGSNPFIRSISWSSRGDVAEWLGTGLQNPLHRFNSGRRLLKPPLGTAFFPVFEARDARVYGYMCGHDAHGPTCQPPPNIGAWGDPLHLLVVCGSVKFVGHYPRARRRSCE